MESLLFFVRVKIKIPRDDYFGGLSADVVESMKQILHPSGVAVHECVQSVLQGELMHTRNSISEQLKVNILIDLRSLQNGGQQSGEAP